MQDRRSVQAQPIKDRSLLGGMSKTPKAPGKGCTLAPPVSTTDSYLRPNARYCFYTTESQTSTHHTFNSPKAGKALPWEQWAAGTGCVTHRCTRSVWLTLPSRQTRQSVPTAVLPRSFQAPCTDMAHRSSVLLPPAVLVYDDKVNPQKTEGRTIV